jgi:hypothetical protein
MTLRSNTRAVKISALVGLSLVCLAQSAVAGKTPDTPESLMAKAKAYAASSKTAMALGQKLYEDLSTKKPFAVSLLSAAQSEDKKAVAKAIAAELKLSESQVTIEEVDKDVYFRGSYTTDKGTVVKFCVDTSGSNRCGGHSYSVSVAGE